jgi:hypothetical protein
MASIYAVPEIQQALARKERPQVTSWNRLEGRPRRADFDRALRAEVRDALWMLSRQWQMAEFQADDAGSPILAKLHAGSSALTAYRPREHAVQPLDLSVPLETVIERRPPLLTLDVRVQLGRYWLKLIADLGDLGPAFKARYPFVLPDPSRREDAALCAHPEVWQSFAAAAGRLLDGGALYAYLIADAARHAWDGVGLPIVLNAEIDARAALFLAFARRLFAAPAPDEDAWDAARLEYRFACSSPGGVGPRVYTGDEYYDGHFDWFSVDADAARQTIGQPATPPAVPPSSTITRPLIPGSVSFDGMPSTRWWAFEDRKTDFGDVKPDTTDLAKLLLIEFGLVYANDWFLVPLTLPLGSFVRVEGIAVTNVFGERFWVQDAGSKAGDAWQRWEMFRLARRGAGGTVERGLLLPHVLPITLQSRPLEEVLLMRDEQANMVWAIEQTILTADGTPRPGAEAARELREQHARRLAAQLAASPAPVADARAPLRYRVMNTVPEHWIPFVSVHVDGDVRETQLQRAALPRVLEGGVPEPIEPRTTLIREGLDRIPREPYFVYEEEVPRAGVRVTHTYQRARWRDGRTYVWLSARKEIGRGEGSSGLAFDQAVPIPSSKVAAP